MSVTYCQREVTLAQLLRTPPTAFSFTPKCNPQKLSIPNSKHSSLSIPISSLLPIPICSLSPSYQRTVLSKKLEPIKLENQGTKGENKSIKPINKNPISDNTTQFPKSKNWEGYIAATRNSESESDKDGERYWSVDSLVECIVPSSAIALVDLLDPLHSRRRVKTNQRKKEKVKFLGVEGNEDKK